MGQGGGNAAINKVIVAENQSAELGELSQNRAYPVSDSLTPAQDT